MTEPEDKTPERRGQRQRLSARQLPAAIQWSEGMLLAPQHFQQMSLRARALRHYHSSLASPFHWGVLHLQIDHRMLADGKLQILDLEAVMPDGLVVSLPGPKEDPAIDLAEHQEALKEEPLVVHLAVAAQRRGRSPVAGELARFLSIEGEPLADENTGQGELRVPRLFPKARLVAGQEPAQKFDSFPLLEIGYSEETFALTEYVPPSLRISATPSITRMCRQMAARLRQTALELAEQVNAPSASARKPQLLETRGVIHGLVGALPPLEALLANDVAHPFALYQALCGVVGHVGSVGEALVPPALPAYDHDDLRATFLEAQRFITQGIEEARIKSVSKYPFDLHDGVFSLDFDPAWIGSDLVLGVKSREGVSEVEAIEWLERAKIASDSRMASLVGLRIDGAPRKRVEAFRDFVPSRGVILFALTPDPEFVLPGEPLQVRNFDDEAGIFRPVEVVLYVQEKR